jgi:hypothetical protein
MLRLLGNDCICPPIDRHVEDHIVIWIRGKRPRLINHLNRLSKAFETSNQESCGLCCWKK